MSNPLLQGMATSHSLTTIAGKLSGDPLDIKMFEATNWVSNSAAFLVTSTYPYIMFISCYHSAYINRFGHGLRI